MRRFLCKNVTKNAVIQMKNEKADQTGIFRQTGFFLIWVWRYRIEAIEALQAWQMSFPLNSVSAEFSEQKMQHSECFLIVIPSFSRMKSTNSPLVTPRALLTDLGMTILPSSSICLVITGVFIIFTFLFEIFFGSFSFREFHIFLGFDSLYHILPKNAIYLVKKGNCLQLGRKLEEKFLHLLYIHIYDVSNFKTFGTRGLFRSALRA